MTDNKKFNEIISEEIPNVIKELEQSNQSVRLSNFLDLVRYFFPHFKINKSSKDEINKEES